MSATSTVSVVIPTYRRPDVLLGCLKALGCQRHIPMEVLVCRRVNDELTAGCLDSFPSERYPFLRQIIVGPNDNFGASLNAGIMASCGDLVVLTDDDAEAPEDWLQKLVESFTTSTIAGVGGKDLQPHNPPGEMKQVGKVSWYGRVTGNHHIGIGEAREVDVLKGVHCCLRGELAKSIGIDLRLRGAGMVMHTELSLCLPLRKRGCKIIYDPSITVLHHTAPRQDGDPTGRGGFDSQAQISAVHNETLSLLDYLSWPSRLAFWLWSLSVGTRAAPGIAQIVRLVLTGQPIGLALRRGVATLSGRLRGTWTWLSSQRDLPPSKSAARSLSKYEVLTDC